MNAHVNMNDPHEQDPIKVWQEFHRDNVSFWTPRRKRLESLRPPTSGPLSDDFLEAATSYDDCCQRLQHELSERLRTAGLTLQTLKRSLTDSEADVLRLMTTQVLGHTRRTGAIPWDGLTSDLEEQLEEDSESSDEEPQELAVDAMDQNPLDIAFVPPSTLTRDDDPAKGLPWYSRQYKKPAAAMQRLAVPSTLAGPSAAGPSGNWPPVPAVMRTASTGARFSEYSLVSDVNTRGTTPLPAEDKWGDIEDFYDSYGHGN